MISDHYLTYVWKVNNYGITQVSYFRFWKCIDVFTVLFKKSPVLLTRLTPEGKPKSSRKKTFLMASGTAFTHFERESKLPAKSDVLISADLCSSLSVYPSILPLK